MKDKIAVLLSVLFLISGFIYTYKKELELNQFGVYTIGTIIKLEHIGKVRYSLVYEFIVDGKIEQGSVGVVYFKCDDESIACVGKEFDVIYSSKNSKINEMILGKYEEYRGKIRLVPLPKKTDVHD